MVWIGGKTSGRGHSSPYGAFKYEGRRWFAHRWAAKFIHGMEIDGLHVDHCCPHISYPNSLCVQHVQPLTLLENVALQHRRTWIHTQVGLLPPPPVAEVDPEAVPFYVAPEWFVKAKPGYVAPQLSDTPF